MKAWFDDPQQLIRSDKITQFWPNSKQTPEERINAASRFIIYTTCIIYLIRRDVRIFVLGATVLSVLYVLYTSKMIEETYGETIDGRRGQCHMPTEDNPMGNVLMTDYTDAPNRLEACYYASVKPQLKAYVDDRIAYDSGRSRSPHPIYQRNASARQFITAPVTKIPGDQTQFAEWLYGPRDRELCRSHPGMCSPDTRGVQLEAYSGLNMSNDIRGL